ncbi:MAG: hypothetical protein PUE58_01900 [Lachnospiraceae bacterium]|nr:hypothetical protein [Lachnospiraceae bacterium]
MGATGTPGETGNAAENGNAAETFTQEQVDAIVKDRLSRERDKYKDYADLKSKAAEYDKQQEANKTELQKAQEQAESLKKELAGLKEQEKTRGIRKKVSEDTGVPEDLLTGNSEEDCKTQAEAILKFAKGSKYPGIKETGHKSNTTSPTSADDLSSADYREMAHQIFGRKE